MKKVLKITGKIFLVLLLLIIAVFAVLFIYNRIMLANEEKLIDEIYPGEPVEVNGHSMNVYVSGEGEHTLVFLAPAGDTAPALTFEPLYSALDDEYRTAVVEKFGYGMSDKVDTERDYKLMVDECREALDKSGVTAPYILCPYSKSGLDTLIWAQSYPDEVEAIVSIDMAVPGHFEEIDISSMSGGAGLMDFARGSGLIRLFVSDSMFPDTMSEERKDLEKAMIFRNYSNKVTVNEMITVPAACDMINSGTKPSCPMLMFLTNGEGTDMDTKKWQGYTKSYTEGLNVSYTEFDCGHGKIIENSDQMAEEIRDFINTLD